MPTSPPILREESSGGCTDLDENEPLCDPTDPSWVDDGYEETYAETAAIDFVPSESTPVESGAYNNPPQTCPDIFSRTLQPLAVAAPRPDGTSQWVVITSTGTWSRTYGMPFAYPIVAYNWPPGYWPTIDGSGVTVQVGWADGVCNTGLTSIGGTIYSYWQVTFQNGHNVNARFPRRRSVSNTGGAGGGGGSNCYQEYVYLEIDYGDGTGWHTLWEGYATVCG